MSRGHGPGGTTHGHSSGGRRTATYQSWSAMRDRCTLRTHPQWHRYGGRGITVAARWSAFEAFLADMGIRPTGTSLERIDNVRGYEPGNCRWATRTEQANNRDQNHLVTAHGETMTITQWARKTGVGKTTIRQRLAAGWPPASAVSEPPMSRHEACAAALRGRWGRR